MEFIISNPSNILHGKFKLMKRTWISASPSFTHRNPWWLFDRETVNSFLKLSKWYVRAFFNGCVLNVICCYNPNYQVSDAVASAARRFAGYCNLCQAPPAKAVWWGQALATSTHFIHQDFSLLCGDIGGLKRVTLLTRGEAFYAQFISGALNEARKARSCWTYLWLKGCKLNGNRSENKLRGNYNWYTL